MILSNGWFTRQGRLFFLILVNAITTLRLLSAGGVFYLAIIGLWFAAACLLLIGFASDLLDGNIARKKGVVTQFGTFFDGQVDRLLLISPIAALALSGVFPKVSAIIMIVVLYLIDRVAYEPLTFVYWLLFHLVVIYELWSKVTKNELIFLSAGGLLLLASVVVLQRFKVVEFLSSRKI